MNEDSCGVRWIKTQSEKWRVVGRLEELEKVEEEYRELVSYVWHQLAAAKVVNLNDAQLALA